MPRFAVADPPRRKLGAPAEIRSAVPHIVSIRSQYMDNALVEHPFGPILCTGTERAGERPGRDLHPHPGTRQCRDERIV
jgi:hypothetical protein